MSYKTWQCPYCKKYTRHEEMSLREVSGLEKDSEFAQFVNGINDYIGMSKVVSLVSGRKFYKCCECGYAALRSSSGKILRIVVDTDHPAFWEALDNWSKGKKSGF